MEIKGVNYNKKFVGINSVELIIAYVNRNLILFIIIIVGL